MKRYYFDHAATTPLDRRVLEAMMPYLTECYANPSSSHAMGREACRAVDEARDGIARLLGRKPKEVYFTSGGTEADNWALKGAALANRERGRHILISAFEHPAVFESASFLQKQGYEVELIPVRADGIVDLTALSSLLREDTCLVAVMSANNEVGTIQPLAEIATLVHEKGALFFTDAVQAMGELPAFDGADLLSFSSHKLYGPKGVGALVVGGGVKLERLHHGGMQERSLRGGTTPTAQIVGFSKAFSLACAEREDRTKRVRSLRDRFLKGILSLPGTALNGDGEKRLASNANIFFEGRNGQALLNKLDLAGICASAGSACTSGAVHPSHTLLAMGKEKEASSSIRFSFGKDNTETEIDEVLSIIETLLSPVRTKNISS